jgi:hypothetical protein
MKLRGLLKGKPSPLETMMEERKRGEKIMRRYVLDSSALMIFFTDRVGAIKVEDFIRDAVVKKVGCG